MRTPGPCQYSHQQCKVSELGYLEKAFDYTALVSTWDRPDLSAYI